MKRMLIVVSIIIVIILAIGIITNANASTGFEDPEAAKIISTMEHAYALIDEVAQTGDVSKYTQVFVDTSDFQADTSEKEFVGKVLGTAAAQKIGILTAMQAKGIANGRGQQLLKNAMDKANAENRQISPAELQQLIKDNYGSLPGVKAETNYKLKLTYQKLEIFKDKAIITYDDEQAIQQAILVKIDGQWFISNVKAIHVHF